MVKPKAKTKIQGSRSPNQKNHGVNQRPPVFLPEVFILESLGAEDERKGRFEGRALADMLRMSGKEPIYHYFRHEGELPHFVKIFTMSKYRYLHLSCHGDVDKIFTRCGEISNYALARIFENSLKLKRLFFSACLVGNRDFSEIIAAKNKGMHSIVAPVQKIRFDHAAALWNALYLSLFTENEERMTHERIISRLKALRQLFPIDFHFSGYNSHDKENPWSHLTITEQPPPRIPHVGGQLDIVTEAPGGTGTPQLAPVAAAEND